MKITFKDIAKHAQYSMLTIAASGYLGRGKYTSVGGYVLDAHHLLSASDSFAYFGDQDAFGTAEDRKMGETRHSVELLMRKQ